MDIELKVKPLYDDTKIPVREHPNDSGADVFAHNINRIYVQFGSGEDCITKDNVRGKGLDESLLEFPLELKPAQRVLIGTGIAATVGKGYEIQARSRSGIPLKVGVIVGNSPGTIDEPYRGEIGIIYINTSNYTQVFNKGDKIAQIVVAPVVIPKMVIVKELDETDRGDGGFGSTGTN